MRLYLTMIVVVLALAIFTMALSVPATWNGLNKNYEAVNSAKSQYSGALNFCSQKIELVWTAADQYLTHEKETLVKVTEARNGFTQAMKDFQQAGDIQALTKAGAEANRAAMSFQIQIEAYPQLKGDQTTLANMRNMEEAVNEIKTALDDWIVVIRDYNTYRNSFRVMIIASFMSKFPKYIDYYQGEITKLEVDKLNPQKK